MRNNHFIHYFCSVCGNQLSLAYSTKDNPIRTIEGDNSQEPTGADKLITEILIKPCAICLEPINKLKQAMGLIKCTLG